jgi:glycerophosphoryl diester phosphodiesterase
MDDVHSALPLWVGIDFEIKFDLGDARTDDDIHACLRWAYDHGRERPLVVTSFDPATVKEATLLWLPSGWITHQGAPLYESVASAARLGCSVAVVHEDAVLAAQDTNPGTGDVRELLYDTGLRLWAWNVHAENVPILVAAGVTGLCTDEIAPLVPLVPYHS